MKKLEYYRKDCPIISSTPADFSHFVGFHDICPWNQSNNILAVHRTSQDIFSCPKSRDKAEICLWNIQTGIISVIGETNAWSWEQGARLQWLPSSENILLYNICENGAFRGVLHNVDTGEKRNLSFSIYSISSDGQYALSPHFGRLHACWPSYGYDGGTSPSQSLQIPDDDGIYLLNLKNNKVKLLISIAEAASICDEYISPKIHHFLTHPVFNPSGTAFCFIHRFFSPDHASYSRLIVADRDGTNLRLIANEYVSHFCWLDDQKILVWTRFIPNTISTARRKGVLASPLFKPFLQIARGLTPKLKQRLFKQNYYIIDVDHPESPYPFLPHLLEQDGHPMLSYDGRWIVTDTYADSSGMQTLILIDMVNEVRVDIKRLTLSELYQLNHLKCDLHPRWDRVSKRVCVDSSHSRVRQVYIIDVTNIIN